MNRKNIFYWLLLPVLALIMGACGETDDEDVTPETQTGEYVKDFKRVKQYGETKQFQDDLDAFATYAIEIQAFRHGWWMLLSNGFVNGNAFCATFDDIEGEVGTLSAEFCYNVIDGIVENADKYEEAMERLQYSGILPDPKASATRGWLADGLNFIYNCRNAQKMGRQSVMAIMHYSSIGTNPTKLKELFDLLPSNLRRGYSDYASFWSDFSRGKLDSRANQIFVNLYTYDPLDFGERARIMGITPGGNVTAAGAKLIESGMNLVIDASPISTQLGYGKDIYGVYSATEKLVKEGDVKGFLQTALTNAVNYGPILYNGMKYGQWEGYDLFNPDEWDLALSQEALNTILNDAVFSDTFQEAARFDLDDRLIPNLVTAKDENGKEVLLVCMVDVKTGRITLGFSMDKEGNISMNPKTPGTKQITVVGKNGKRKTKTIIVPKDKDTTVEVDLDEDEGTLLEDEPKEGFLKLDRSIMEFLSNGGRLKTLVIGNYLYYSCSTKDKWIECSIPSEMNELTVRVAANDSTTKRRGQVTVIATNQQGKVLKTVVLPITQEPKEVTENYITATPSTLEFTDEGGKLSTTVNHSWEYAFTAYDYDDSMAGWATVNASATEQGKFVVTVDAKPNTTGEERSGIITVFAASTRDYRDDALNGNVDPNNVLTTTIMVTQKAGSRQITQVEISSFKFYSGIKTNCTEYHYTHDGKNDKTREYVDNSHEGGYFNQRFYPEYFSSSFTGSSLHVEGKYENRGELYEISFDITGISGDYKEALVTNLTCKRVISESVFGHEKYNLTASYTNIPLSKAYIAFASNPLSLSRLHFKGKVADGMGISGHSCEKYTNDGWGGYTHYHFDYLDDGENFADLEIDLSVK
jgi:hypothetical protein